MEYFFETAVKCKNSKKKNSTHLAIVNDGKVRYLISNDGTLRNHARKVLAYNVSSYSKKLGMLMRSLTLIPDFVLKLAHLGKTVSVVLPDEIADTMTEVAENRWLNKKWGYNIIVGSYVEKQKIVIQCFTEDGNDTAIYFKVCSDNAKAEIENETNYLREPIRSKLFENPKLCYSKLQKDGAQFNIQVTEEFTGTKVNPELTQEIYQLFQEIAGFRKQETNDGELLCFSHGDFTPWNLRKNSDGKYIVFDWEYCRMRFYGFDLIHYLWQIENKLNGKNKDAAIKAAIETAKEYDERLRVCSDEKITHMYFHELKMQFGEIL